MFIILLYYCSIIHSTQTLIIYLNVSIKDDKFLNTGNEIHAPPLLYLKSNKRGNKTSTQLKDILKDCRIIPSIQINNTRQTRKKQIKLSYFENQSEQIDENYHLKY